MFQITPEAQKAVIRHLSEDGYLELRLERAGNKVRVSGMYEDQEVLVFDELLPLFNGDTLTLSGLKIKLDLE